MQGTDCPFPGDFNIKVCEVLCILIGQRNDQINLVRMRSADWVGVLPLRDLHFGRLRRRRIEA